MRSLFSRDGYSYEEADLGGDIYYNSTLRWQEDSGEECVFGLSTDLLIEVLQWSTGVETSHGPDRLASLRSWLRFKAEETRGRFKVR